MRDFKKRLFGSRRFQKLTNLLTVDVLVTRECVELSVICSIHAQRIQQFAKTEELAWRYAQILPIINANALKVILEKIVLKR